ncbi:MAG: hypothetical protein A2249_02880 [Candidatus Jacksonbacteria bacterium RIFOXYA2_FULL_44_7]|uniref:PKD domain-containing protein n=1 Tax=Candidatus Jacksonbacteria bacterium RIFCSPLOWO2_02_FULL_44_20 TaxID=1798460 RepID=A0A1G2A7I7_9BACT|nr:MAG: hypothetical protein UW39_C0005G0085 [Parcubacteria group bacterium GW2011_GWC2_44_17]KKT49624.1 MAG: hypothetical protein UW40_C0018G0011 [Parcubacteria group bacterium GW2011_GWF2_44_17]OGY69560.1 MAG: hypothetical protein A3C00_02985 [Candidatus Jacksonbacteria bacterium RIFCSPHIGHO2_02_FULL_44_25]OGY70040.1 MAG: hypothetical protein A3E05_02490 [Candidatus Jacksonbacteria bacterium RIFCSPHIGHO2_12_FULL_44_12]OGY72635.1 MAG: hypothetical protein A3H61_03450 [Candidatus Jacksonbacteri
MRIRKLAIVFIILGGAVFNAPFFVSAAKNTVVPDAGEDKTVFLGERVEFSAIKSVFPSELTEAEVEYWWNFGDRSPAQKGITVSRAYAKEGDYTAEVIIKTPIGDFVDSVIITVTAKTLFMIVGRDEDAIHFTNLINQAERLDFLITTVVVDDRNSDITFEDRILGDILDHKSELARARLIIGWTKGSTEMNSLLRLEAGLLSNASIVIASDSPGLTTRRGERLYDIVKPKNVAAVLPSLLKTALQGEASGDVISAIQKEGSGFTLIGVHSRRNGNKVTFYNFFSHFINALVKRGVSVNTILLILMLPIVATIVSFFRHVVGIKSLGVYIPSILTITFVAIGIYAGLFIILLIVAIGTLMRIALRRLRLQYLPRMAVTITVVSCAILALFYFSVDIPNFSLVSISAFPMLILIMLVEEFVKVQIEEGARGAFVLTLETILLSMVSYFIVNGTFFRSFLISYPEIIFLSFLVNIFLGKWTGLRLWEYYRFREVIAAMHLKERKSS